MTNRSMIRPLARAGATLPELLVGATVTAMIAAGMLVTIVALQKSAAASRHHASSQIHQARILDYVARDLRRAITVMVESTEAGECLSLTIPDYYDADGRPREATITGETISYGGSPIQIRYFRQGGVFCRSVNGATTRLASDVADFDTNFADSGEQTVGVTITFHPRYRFGSNTVSTLRTGTAASNTTLLRNKRN